jgi:hypothetical protein
VPEPELVATHYFVFPMQIIYTKQGKALLAGLLRRDRASRRACGLGKVASAKRPRFL